MKIPVLIILAAAATLISFAGETATSPATPACCVKPLPPAQFSERSIFQLESTWLNDQARPVHLATLKGKPQIVTMFFSTCVAACPLLLNDMKKIEAALPEQVRTNVGFVLVSFDSERDTPAVLARYRKQHALPANWTLLRGEPDDVLELAAVLGIKFKKDERGDFAHSNLISLLDSRGEVVMQQSGLNRDPGPLSLAAHQLLK